MRAPDVSVIVPTYNRLPLLRETIASVLAQTCPSWELIVVDDGSTDGTLDYVRGLSDPRVRALALPHSGSVSRVCNAGAREARGEYLAFLGSDDLWLPDKLTIQLEHMRRAGVRWSHTRYDMIDADGRPVPWRSGEWRPASGWIARDLIAYRATACICTMLIERELFDKVGGFDEAIGPRQDYDLTLRLAVAAETLAIPETLTLVRDHAGRSIYHRQYPFEDAIIIFDKAARVLPPELRPDLRRQRAYNRVEAAASRFARRQPIAGLRLLAQAAALRARPRDLAWALYRGTQWALTGGRPA